MAAAADGKPAGVGADIAGLNAAQQRRPTPCVPPARTRPPPPMDAAIESAPTGCSGENDQQRLDDQDSVDLIDPVLVCDQPVEGPRASLPSLPEAPVLRR